MSYATDSAESATVSRDASLDIATNNDRTGDNIMSQDKAAQTRGLLSKFAASVPKPKMLMHPYAQYSRLSTDGEEDAGANSSTRSAERLQAYCRSLWRWRITSALLAVTLFSLGLCFWTGRFQLAPLPPNADITSLTADLHSMPLSCGNTTAAAVRRDCLFNPLSNRWLPKRCVVALSDHIEPMLKTIDPEPYKFYRDPEGSQEILGHEWAHIDLETIVWTTERHHITRCVNLLAQGAGQLIFGGMIEEQARDWDHVKHCVDTILSVGKGLPGWNSINSFVKLRSGECY